MHGKDGRTVLLKLAVKLLLGLTTKIADTIKRDSKIHIFKCDFNGSRKGTKLYYVVI